MNSKSSKSMTNSVPDNLSSNLSKRENGITSTVNTYYSSITIGDILNIIAQKKADAVIKWINSLDYNVETPMVVGTYLTGVFIALKLRENHSIKNIEVLDIYNHLGDLIKSFEDNFKYLSEEKIVNDKSYKNPHYKKILFSNDLSHLKKADVVFDTTGLGGLDIKHIKKLNKCKIFITEDPCSDGSDNLIKDKNLTSARLKSASAQYKARIFTSGLMSKTSGTMTLTMDVLRKSVEEILKTNGVLYAVASLDFYEGILFKEKNTEKFLESVNRPAMIVSSINPVQIDKTLFKIIEKIKVEILD
ncbi:MAG: SAM-dependent methyltransferase HcgC family protein [Methanobacteriaceae archaeon]|nr:SAM-dependent methyltransferase HcgC family protein [Methanobacteriaceae archaeon]